MDRKPRIREKNFQCQYSGRVWVDSWGISSELSHLSYHDIVADSFKPLTLRQTQVVQKSPVSYGHVSHETRRSVKLRVSVTANRWYIGQYVFRCPTAACHNHAFGFQSIQLPILRGSNLNCLRAVRFSFVIYRRNSRL